MRAPLVTLFVLVTLSSATGVAAREAGPPPGEGPFRGAALTGAVLDTLPAPAAPAAPVSHAGLWWPVTEGAPALPAGRLRVAGPAWDAARQEESGGTRLSLLGGVGGFVLGAAVGGALGCAANRDDYGVFCGGQDDTKVFVGAAIGAVAGAALGAYLFRRDG